MKIVDFTMPKNKGKGGKQRRKGKKEEETKRELVFAKDSQTYAQVMKMSGDCRMEVVYLKKDQKDATKKHICHIPGALKRKVWVNAGDIVLVSIRGLEDKCDLLLKYSPEESRNLKAYGEIPDTANIQEDDVKFDGPTDPNSDSEKEDPSEKEGESESD